MPATSEFLGQTSNHDRDLCSESFRQNQVNVWVDGAIDNQQRIRQDGKHMNCAFAGMTD